ncbi:dicarboxylate/amino acid:cation symporter [Rheinheimera muenzenbergensis]|uniref:Dicarboxylate/amino acid:cation symporter n=1 Tax=Rheinheimera muenzenbergensis TaxID=1193628 RepID=A0ABU8CCH5_9GAMM|nr:dicarboxylate/amino acid:cation symporter [Gammaproteobacteria bacterium]MBU1553714.1 dicarboxylate/amino acid:cation symporter [Gammaproteobacteria bacterium]MBU2072346.1 dicarboxylate/amino acid:cation symporter [Gammaproteobacteria bacterium]MBU2183846.1 dicarboxylate/amino acid:cation symporter [Gammaproteobacteria bacterium]MBU2203942.1 dicarboxylate/amino acid:cation symporter [Gammaproteobacteria bacterium]
MTQNKKLGLTARIVIGMVAGILVGFFFKWLLAGQEERILHFLSLEIPLKAFFVNGLLHIGGEIFIASLKMLVVPLVFVSLVCGTCSLSDTSSLGRLGGKTIGLYLITTAMAISLAIFAALLFSPGEGVQMQSDANFSLAEAPPLSQVFINIFPSNPIESMAKGNMLQIIVFAVLFGLAMAMSGKAGERLTLVFNDLSEVIMRLVTLLMNLAPYGVFFLMAKLFTTLGFETIASLAKYFAVVLTVLILHGLLSYGVILKLLTGLNPLMFFRKMRDAALFGFSTSSSNATMPVTMEAVTKKLGVKNSIASFTVPLGATINMDGTAIMQGVATVFIAQVFGVDLTLADYLMVILTATLASVGTAGVPGVGLIMLAMVLQQVGLPVEGIALIIGVDRLLDMTRTAVNVTGDAMVSCIVAKSEKEFDPDVFNDPAAGTKDETIDFQHLR